MALSEQILHSKQQVKQYAVGGISQLSQIIDAGGHLDTTRPDKLSQIAAETKQFISEYLENESLPVSMRSEVLCVLKTLLTIPAPADQVAYLQRIRPLLEEAAGNEVLSNRKKEAENIKVHEAITGLENSGQNSEYCMIPLMNFLSDTKRQKQIEPFVTDSLDTCLEKEHATAAAIFLAIPENQVGRDKEVAQLLETIKKNKKRAEDLRLSPWWTYAALVFFADERNRNLDSALFSDTVDSIDETCERKQLDEKLSEHICAFLVQNTNMEQFSRWFDAVIQTSSAYWVVPNNFFNHPDAWNGNEQIAIELRKKAIAGNQWGVLIQQCTNPKVPKPGTVAGEEQYESNIMDEIVRDEIRGRHGNVNDAVILRYMAHPEHHVDIYDQDTVNQTIAANLEGGTDTDYMAVVDFFNESNVQNFSSATTDMANKVVNRISDHMLRAKSLGLLRTYLTDETLPTTLLESVPADLVITVVAFKLLGVDENVVRSWQLDEENITSLLPSLIHLAEMPANRNMFADIALPFVPRTRESGRKVLVEKITQWLNKLDFLNKVPKELGGKELVEDHLENIKTLQKEHAISDATNTIDLTVLRKFQTELQSMGGQLVEKLTQLIRLKEGISYAQVEQFIKDWNGDISCVIILSAHYSTSYDDGLTYLGQKITEIIEGQAESNRYDLSNQLTKQQLQPLLRNPEVIEQEKAIAVWKDPAYSLKIESSQVKKAAVSDYDLTQKVSAELRQRVTTQGHFHAEKLQELIVGSTSVEQAQKITQLITACVQINTEQPKNLIGQVVQELKQSSLSKERQTLIMGLAQLLREISLGRESASNLANTAQKLVAKITNEWPELAEIDLINQDLKVYVTNEFDAADKESAQVSRAELFVCYTTDNPKTLLEIGRYPNSGSCQNYESTGSYNTGLPGYVFDAHIQAACISSVTLPDVLQNNPEALTNASLSDVDLNLGTAQLRLESGKTFAVKISKPIARKMILLASSTNNERADMPTLLAEPTYADPGVADATIEQTLEDTITAKRSALSKQLGLPVLGNTDAKSGGYMTTIAGSHNPNGHYNDLAFGLRGDNGEKYEISLK